MSKRRYVLAMVLSLLIIVAGCDQRLNVSDPTTSQNDQLSINGDPVDVFSVNTAKKLSETIRPVIPSMAISPKMVEAIVPVSLTAPSQPTTPAPTTTDIVACFVDSSLEFVDQLICNVTLPDRSLTLKSVTLNLVPVEVTEHQGQQFVEVDPRLFGYHKNAVAAELPKSYFPATITITVRLDDRQQGTVRLFEVSASGNAAQFGVDQPLLLGLGDETDERRDD